MLVGARTAVLAVVGVLTAGAAIILPMSASAEPSPSPSASATASSPSATPSASPSADPAPTPSATPSGTPSPTPSATKSATPSPKPSPKPSATKSKAPSRPKPTRSPGGRPSRPSPTATDALAATPNDQSKSARARTTSRRAAAKPHRAATASATASASGSPSAGPSTADPSQAADAPVRNVASASQAAADTGHSVTVFAVFLAALGAAAGCAFALVRRRRAHPRRVPKHAYRR